MKAPQQEFPNVPSKMLPKLVLTFTSVDSQIFFFELTQMIESH